MVLTKKEIKKKSFKIRELIEKFDLNIINEGISLDAVLEGPNVYRSGPVLTGYFDEDSDILENHIHIFDIHQEMFLLCLFLR